MDVTPAAYDEVADAYSRARDPDGAGLADPVLEELIGAVSGQEVLSLACGQGHDARLLAGLGARVTGIDLSEEMLRYAREQEAAAPRGIVYVHGDAQELAGCEDASFDGVVCVLALMDIPDLQATARTVARVLRRPGWFVFSIVHPCYDGHVGNVTDYLVEERYLKAAPPDWLPPHAYHRPLEQVMDALLGAGFRLERLREPHARAEDACGVPGFLYARWVVP